MHQNLRNFENTFLGYDILFTPMRCLKIFQVNFKTVFVSQLLKCYFPSI